MPARAAHPPCWLAGLAVVAYHLEYVLSFSFVGLVEPIAYGTCDALRRLLIIEADARGPHVAVLASLRQSKTEGVEEALVALDALSTVDAAAAVCRWSCDLSGIKIKKQQKEIVR